MDKKQVILYSTGCPKCDILKRKLHDQEIEFQEENSVEKMLALGISQVPVLSVDGELLSFADAVRWVNSMKEVV